MTYEEAIYALKYINLSRVHHFLSWEEMGDVRDIAIEALEKQKPKLYCPRCERLLDGNDFCSHCGQAINWEE